MSSSAVAKFVKEVEAVSPVKEAMMIASKKYDLVDQWTKKALKIVEEISDDVELGGRVDLRDMPFVTIDGEDAKDFDDAVYAHKTKTVMSYGIEHQIASIMITGSHIPEDRNGIKFNTPFGEILKQDEAVILGQTVDFPEQQFNADDMSITSFYNIRRIEQAATNYNPTPTYSHVFPRADDPALNGDATIQDIVNVLNQNAASANATFYVVGNSWAIRCNEGYEWLESQDPAWGGDSGAGQSINRGVAKADWDGGDNEYRADSGTMNNTYNGMPDMGSNADSMGCSKPAISIWINIYMYNAC
ncbi:hypothetical protein EGW08_022289 [Elysia chlorotica]|uniref:Alpha-D-phosphohexomutase alpha/beta/alpha domain-containing protein n=1 Tax=Elysia chlorotica TaxID=188477 RepID=A0A433SLA9_ELYCH|nr:hypothetical protein EGW08_022289 [Elysia chlorotica]